ncbi:MAG: DUF1127 domain-containing protein [Pseudomonadota bacterium]
MHQRTITAPILADLASTLYNSGARLARWITQTHQRIQAHGKLSQLNDHMLRDIGVERQDLLMKRPDYGPLNEHRLSW